MSELTGCEHPVQYIVSYDEEGTEFCALCSLEAGQAMLDQTIKNLSHEARIANDRLIEITALRNALNLASGRAVDLEAEVKDLRGELTHLRTEREREPGNDMLKVMHACSVSAYNEAKAERAAYGDKMTSRVGELEAEIAKLRSAFVEAQKKVHIAYHGMGTPIEECGNPNCIAAIEAGA